MKLYLAWSDSVDGYGQPWLRAVFLSRADAEAWAAKNGADVEEWETGIVDGGWNERGEPIRYPAVA